MKKIFVFAAFCITIAACGSGNNSGEQKSAQSGSGDAGTATATGANDAALEMIGSQDCMACHKINGTNIGPAYVDVAKKYAPTDANIEMLANKVIKGGSGNWGTAQMTAHPNLSLDSAKTIVRYILSLKK